MKRLLALLLTLVMVWALSAGTRAYAVDPTGSITIQNAAIGTTYKVYRPFLATYGDGGAAYVMKANALDPTQPNPWYNLINGSGLFVLTQVTTAEMTYNVAKKSGVTDAQIIAWFNALTDQQLLDNNIQHLYSANHTNGTTETFSNLSLGYYLIRGNQGSVVTLTNVNSHVTVIDKNQMPGWYDPIAGDDSLAGKNVLSLDGTTWGPTNTASIANTVSFRVDAFAPKYAGDKEVNAYKFTDTLGAGFTFNNDLKVKINGNELPATAYSLTVDGNTFVVNLPVGPDYPADAIVTLEYTALLDGDAVYDNPNNVSMDWTLINVPYDLDGDPATPPLVDHDNNPATAPVPVVIPYDHDNDPATPPVVDHDGDPTTAPIPVPGLPYDHDNNPATPPLLDHDNDPTTAPIPVPGIPYDHDGDPATLPVVDHDGDPTTDPIPVPNDYINNGNPIVVINGVPTILPPFDNATGDTPMNTETHTYTYGFNLQKYKDAATAGNELTGAAFRLYKEPTGGSEVALVKQLDGTYEVVGATGGEQILAGFAKIFGLAEGTYYLEEVVTPTGYNPLPSRVAVVISAAGDGAPNGETAIDGIMNTQMDIINMQGTILPPTGGIGTTIFYVIGGLMMMGALVLLVTRKKLSANAE